MASVLYYRTIGAYGDGITKLVRFEGSYLSCLELKQRVVYVEHMMPNMSDAQFDFIIEDSQTASQFPGDCSGIRKNSSVNMKRVHATYARSIRLRIEPGSGPTQWLQSSTHLNNSNENTNATTTSHLLDHTPNAHSIPTEDFTMASAYEMNYSGILPVVNLSQQQQQQQSIFVHNNKRPMSHSVPSSTYTCRRCKLAGHFIQFCPTNNDAGFDKRSSNAKTPIHVSINVESDPDAEAYKLKAAKWLKKVDMQHITMDHATKQQNALRREADARAIKEKNSLEAQKSISIALLCHLCKNPFFDAHVIHCCYATFCYGCITNHFASSKLCPRCDTIECELEPNINMQRVVNEYKKIHFIN
jgi:hypothetical protein